MKTVKIFLLILLTAVAGVAGHAQNQPRVTNTLQLQQTDVQLALQYYNNREFEKAAAAFGDLYQKNPNKFNYTYLNLSYQHLEQFDKAEQVVENQIKKYPDEMVYVVDLGYVYTRNNKVKKGLELYEKAIENVKPDKNKINELASTFISKREYEHAIRVYEKGKLLFPTDAQMSSQIANLHNITGNFEGMMNELMAQLDADESAMPQVQNQLQQALRDDTEDAKNRALRYALLTRIQAQPDNNAYMEMYVWQLIQQKDFETALSHTKAMDRRLQGSGERVLELAMLSVSNNNYEVALDAFNYVIERSKSADLVSQAKAGALGAEYAMQINTYPVNVAELKKLETRYQKQIEEFGSNPLSFALIRDLAHLQAFYLKNADNAIQLLEGLIGQTSGDKMAQAETKLELADIMLFSGEVWEATLLYSQVDKAFKSEPIGHEARFRNARLSFYINEFDWAKAQLDVLKAATSKLIANDAMALSLLIGENIEADSLLTPLATYAHADLLLFQNRIPEALGILDSLMIAYPHHAIVDDALMKKAEIHIKVGKFTLAETLYQQVVDEFKEGFLVDDALFKLGILYEKYLKDSEKARATYERLMMEHPGSIYNIEARKKFRELRGDNVV